MDIDRVALEKKNDACHALLTRLPIEIARLEFTLSVLQARRMDAERDSQYLSTRLFGALGIPTRPTVADIESERKRVESILSRAFVDMARLKGQCVQYELATRRQNDLPREIWATIFGLCMPDEDCLVWSMQKPPLVFTRVCASWRTIAIRTPRLWTSLALPLSTVPRWRKQFDVMMERSGVLPLSLEVSWYPSSYSDEDDGFRAFWPALLETSWRWRHLRLFLPPRSLLGLLDRPIPRLESLCVGGSSNIIPFKLWLAPCLKSVTFDGPNHTRFFNAVELPALRELELVKPVSDVPLRAEEWFMKRIEALAERCKPPLQKVVFYGSAPTDFDLHCFVQNMPSIRDVVYNVIGNQTHTVAPDVVAILSGRKIALDEFDYEVI